MIRPGRSVGTPRSSKAGSSAAAVPSTAQRAPVASAASSVARSRRPPPTWTGTPAPPRTIAGDQGRMPGRAVERAVEVHDVEPPRPALAQRRAIATGSSAKTVSLSAPPLDQPDAAAALAGRSRE